MKKLFAFCLVMLPLVLGGCGSEPEAKPPRRVKAMTVLGASSLSTSVFPGRATAGQEVNLSFRVGGPLVEVEGLDFSDAQTLQLRFRADSQSGLLWAVDDMYVDAQSTQRVYLPSIIK